MCGIIGIINSQNKKKVDKAIRSIEHRGPDATRVMTFGNTVLGHTRLSIQDLSETGSQPMISSDGRFAIVFNGEIYNADKLLAEEVQIKDFLRGTSDTEILLEYLASNMKKGLDLDALLNNLNGIFAFVVYDLVENKCWFVRDHIGIKPLYYHMAEEEVYFCSEVNALIRLGINEKSLSVKELSRYLCFLWKPGDIEAVNGINSVPAGSFLEICPGEKAKLKAWYELPLSKKQPKSNADLSSIVGEVQSTIKEVVQSQLISDAPVGCFLSGGLDSSSICYFANQASKNDLAFFTIDAGQNVDEQQSDLPHALDVANHLGVELNIIPVTPQNFVENLERMVLHLGEPIADPAALNTLFICEAANEKGIKVMLSGTGGDDVFTGYRRHIIPRYSQFIKSYIKPCEGIFRSSLNMFDRVGLSSRRIKKLSSGLFLNDDDRLVEYFFWTGALQAQSILNEKFKYKISHEQMAQPLKDYLMSLPQGLTNLEKALLLEQKFFMTNHNLIYGDRMSMATGVEMRVPFLDPKIIELASKIPDKFLQKGLTGKWILKKAMEPFLPNKVIYRSKTGFGLPVRDWMHAALEQLEDTHLSSSALQKYDFFNATKVSELIKRFQKNHTGEAYTLLAIACIQIWCAQTFDT